MRVILGSCNCEKQTFSTLNQIYTMRSKLSNISEFLVHKCLKSECPGIVCLRWNKSERLGSVKLKDQKIEDILERV